MNIKKILWITLIVCILVTIPALAARVNVEQANNTYEITIPYLQIQEMINMGMDQDVVLRELKDAGMQSVGFEPMTLGTLVSRNIVSVSGKSEVIEVIGEENGEILPDTETLYLEIVEKESPLVDSLFQVMNYDLHPFGSEVDVIEHDERLFFIIPNTTIKAMTRYVGYDFESLSVLNTYGIKVIPRLSNDFIFSLSHPLVQQFSEIVQLTNADKILFQSDEVTGFPKIPGTPSFLPEVAEFVQDHQLSLVEIENFGQKGLMNLGYLVDADIIRLRSFTLGKGKETSVTVLNEAIRAINERNIRIVYINLLLRNVEIYENQREAEFALNGTVKFLTSLQKASDLQVGSATPFQELNQPFWLKLVVMAGVTLLVALFAQLLHPKLMLPAFGAIALVVLAQIVTGNPMLLKIITLGAAVLAPIFAVLAIKPFQSWKGLVLELAKAFGIAIIGAWVVVTLLYGNEFLVKLNAFSGVKVLAGLPIIIVTLILFRKYARILLNQTVKYWHLIILGILAIGFWFYIGRTGNQGILLPFELEIRQWLESNAGVRPRTKEFLIGYPLFILGLYLTKIGKEWAKSLYIFGAIAFSSMVGTFTHLHTPLLTSVQRAFTGLAFGIIIGVTLIIGYHLVKKLYPMIKERLVS